MAVVNYGGTMSVVQNFTSNVDRLKAAVAGDEVFRRVAE